MPSPRLIHLFIRRSVASLPAVLAVAASLAAAIPVRAEPETLGAQCM